MFDAMLEKVIKYYHKFLQNHCHSHQLLSVSLLLSSRASVFSQVTAASECNIGYFTLISFHFSYEDSQTAQKDRIFGTATLA
jgi:hypothetical protein